MKLTVAAALIVASLGPADGHCFKIWHYNFPQKCGVAYHPAPPKRVASREIAANEPPTPPVKEVQPSDLPPTPAPEPEMPVPALTWDDNPPLPDGWDQDMLDHMKGIGLLRDLREQEQRERERVQRERQLRGD